MSLEQHFGFDVATTRPTFEGAGLELVRSRKFQLGLNNLFVFRNPARGSSGPPTMPGAPGFRAG